MSNALFEDVVNAYESAPLQLFTKKELCDELLKREGVNYYDTSDGYVISIGLKTFPDRMITDTGVVRILVVK